IFVNGELIAEGKGHFALFAEGEADLREANQLWLFPTEATTVTIYRRPNAIKFKTAEVGEWRNSKWRVLERAKIWHEPNAVTVKIDDDLKGEILQLHGE
ncbi:MAG: hypothetical protein NZ937_07300, partial [Armatimonadetes bacterium]|nr:hypothetical protein [Armatimonadota bacterium]